MPSVSYYTLYMHVYVVNGTKTYAIRVSQGAAVALPMIKHWHSPEPRNTAPPLQVHLHSFDHAVASSSQEVHNVVRSNE